MSFLLHYFDDSGAEDFEVAAFGWVAVDVAHWLEAMNAWMDFRRLLFEKAAIPTDTELHAVKFIQGRGRPSLDNGTDFGYHSAHRSLAQNERRLIEDPFFSSIHELTSGSR